VQDLPNFFWKREESHPTIQTVKIEQPFEKSTLDIIGELIPHSFKQHKYIIASTYYFKKWVEDVPIKAVNS